MGKSNLGIFLFLLLCSSFLFTFSQVGPLAYNQVFGEPQTYEAETMVGPVHIGGLTRSEARQKLASQTSDWKDTHNVTLEMKEQNIVFQQDFIQFDIPETLNQVEDGERNYFVVEMNESYFGVLQNKVGTDLYNHILINKLSTKITARAEALHKEPLHFSIYQYVEDGTTQLYEVVSEYSITLNEEMDVTDLVNALNGAVVQNQTPFSLLSFVEEEMDQPSLNAVATAVYGAILETNFIIKQRHISTKLPSYAELGKEASVKPKNNHDLVFTNPNEQPYQLNAAVENGELIVKVLGYPLPNSYEITLENSRKIQPRTIVQFSERVPSGESNVKVEGQEGTSVEVYRFVEDKGKVIQKDFISDDYYPPVNRIEVRYGTNDQPPETESGSTNNSGGFSPGGSDDNQAPTFNENENNQSNNSGNSSSPDGDSSENSGENESDSNGNEGTSNGNDSNQAPDDIWEEPQGNTKSTEK
ncbi:VanW family protein [Pontibacillus marinus]|uniref:G5 domain-containing protein n=1 Tax=Pontibacillus marinus BH030004 = DSM 16465 TaxID=1385511 RepID=A0A0A5GAF3_9BACI|nr:VanW family protein [Pontibacillus marinus]KGX88080.1 hypothetical protein N783_08830 [Pontibacillus marinus BH030004 = DSM 16465]